MTFFCVQHIQTTEKLSTKMSQLKLNLNCLYIYLPPFPSHPFTKNLIMSSIENTLCIAYFISNFLLNWCIESFFQSVKVFWIFSSNPSLQQQKNPFRTAPLHKACDTTCNTVPLHAPIFTLLTTCCILHRATAHCKLYKNTW